MLLESALYSKLDSLPISGAYEPEKFEQWLGKEIAKPIELIQRHTQTSIKQHFVTSTVFTNTFNRQCLSWPRLSQAVQSHSGRAPLAFLNAYECAGWGYILRLVQQLSSQQEHKQDEAFLISIIDINAYGYDFWKANEQWGHSGFGLATLLIRNTSNFQNIHVSTSTGINAFTNFAMEVRKRLAKDTALCAAMPFFPQATQTLFDRTLSSFSRLEDRHTKWGHCFGSDPWLSIILSNQEQYDFSKHSAVLACSLALSGYFSIARMDMNPEGLFKLIPSDSQIRGEK